MTNKWAMYKAAKTDRQTATVTNTSDSHIRQHQLQHTNRPMTLCQDNVVTTDWYHRWCFNTQHSHSDTHTHTRPQLSELANNWVHSIQWTSLSMITRSSSDSNSQHSYSHNPTTNGLCEPMLNTPYVIYTTIYVTYNLPLLSQFSYRFLS